MFQLHCIQICIFLSVYREEYSFQHTGFDQSHILIAVSQDLSLRMNLWIDQSHD
jgi:hypothetical protein